MISPSTQPLELPGQPSRMEDEEAESGCDDEGMQDAAGSKDTEECDRHASRHENQRDMNCLGVMDAMMLHKAGSFTFEVCHPAVGYPKRPRWHGLTGDTATEICCQTRE
jgi:hypothetical protein